MNETPVTRNFAQYVIWIYLLAYLVASNLLAGKRGEQETIVISCHLHGAKQASLDPEIIVRGICFNWNKSRWIMLGDCTPKANPIRLPCDEKAALLLSDFSGRSREFIIGKKVRTKFGISFCHEAWRNLEGQAVWQVKRHNVTLPSRAACHCLAGRPWHLSAFCLRVRLHGKWTLQKRQKEMVLYSTHNY